MRRRTREPGSEIPIELRAFTPGDWPGETDRTRFASWCAARHEYAQAKGWPGGAAAIVVEHRRIGFEHSLLPDAGRLDARISSPYGASQEIG